MSRLAPKHVLFVDPGKWDALDASNGWVLWDGCTVLDKGLADWDEIREIVRQYGERPYGILGIEQIVPYKVVGKDVVKTAMMVGRLIECFGRDAILMYRATICTHLCGKPGIGDSGVNQALKDRFGPPYRKGQENFVYDTDPNNKMRKHIWAAFAGAVAMYDRLSSGTEIPQ